MSHPVVVIGGSAGALDAIHDLLSAIPAAASAAFAIVVHISPTTPSLLPQVIGGYTDLSVHEAVDKYPLSAGHIVVAPPDYHMLIESDLTIGLSRDRTEHFSRPAIDPLFDSAAASLGSRAIGVLLSGSNADGATGLAALAAAKARIAIQEPTSALAFEMPRAGLSLTRPDFVGTPTAIGRWLATQIGGDR